MNERAARYTSSQVLKAEADAEPSCQSPAVTSEHASQLREIFQQHAPRVWRTLRALGVHESSVDDAVQEVFLVINHRLAEFEGRSQLSTWIYSITYRVAQAQRRKSFRHQHAEYEDTMPSSFPGPAEVLADVQAAAFVREFCAALSEAKRDVFVLCVLEERSAPEVVPLLNVNLSTVYSRLRSVKIDFRRALQRKVQQKNNKGEAP